MFVLPAVSAGTLRAVLGRKGNSFDEAPEYRFKSMDTKQEGKIIEGEFIPTRKEVTTERHPKGFRQKKEDGGKQKGGAR